MELIIILLIYIIKGKKTYCTDRGIKIGKARVYSYSVSDAPYTGGSTQFDLHLYDIQTFTTLKGIL